MWNRTHREPLSLCVSKVSFFRLINREAKLRNLLRIQDLYRRLATDEQRNNMIFNDILHALEADRSPILLTERKEHLEYLADRLRNFTHNLVVPTRRKQKTS